MSDAHAIIIFKNYLRIYYLLVQNSVVCFLINGSTLELSG